MRFTGKQGQRRQGKSFNPSPVRTQLENGGEETKGKNVSDSQSWGAEEEWVMNWAGKGT